MNGKGVEAAKQRTSEEAETARARAAEMQATVARSSNATAR